MAWRKFRKSAYYGRNYGNEYSRSRDAEIAEMNDRYPRLRAAKFLGLSVKAFDAGCRAIEYRSTEWHHVGKYANPVNYYDTNELRKNPEFWRGAASIFRSKRACEILGSVGLLQLVPISAK